MADLDRLEYLRRLPIGERLELGPVADDELFPFEGEITTRPLVSPILPEPARRGEATGDCPACGEAGSAVIWEDDRWRVVVDPQPHGLPMVAILLPRAHHDLEDLPADLAVELGPMIQRAVRAIADLDAVGRVHVNRWGDGSFHFHVWLLARPLGMWQMRGAMLAIWDDLLPRVPDEEWESRRRRFGASLAASGGQASA